MFVDTHCHIYAEYYDNIDELIKKIKASKISKVINNGCDGNSNKEVIELINKYDCMYGAIGIHPEYASTYSQEDLKYIEKNLDNKKVVAIGEIGLDYHYGKENKDLQIKNVKGLYVGGDGAGLTRGLAQAGASGIYVARNIINKK